MKHYTTFLIIFITLYTTKAIAQDNLDSLKIVLESNVHDTIKLKVLTTLAWKYQRKDIDKCITYGTQLLLLSQKVADETKQAQAYNLLGIGYDAKNYGLDTITETYQKGIAIANSINELNLKANILNNMALTYKEIGQTGKALELHQEALIIAEKIGEKATAVRCLNNLAIILKDENDLENAKKYYLKGLKYSKELNNQQFIAYLTNNLALVYNMQNKVDSALILYEKSLELKRAIDDQYGVVTTLANIGSIYIDEKLYERAYPFLEESYTIAVNVKYIYGIGLSLSSMGEGYYQQKKYPNAIKYAKEGLTTLGNNGDIMLRMDCYELLSDSYKAQGNYKLAFQNKELYHSFADSIYNIEKNEQINKLEIQYQVTQKETENKLLKAEKEIAEQTIKDRTLIAVGLILALILAITWGTFIFKADQQKKKLNEILEAKVTERTFALQTANQNLEQANYELRTFNYIASHDIKEPIRNIGSYTGLIFRKLPIDLKENLGEYFDTIKQSTSRLYTLIEDFANYTTMSKNEVIEKQEVNLYQLSNNIVTSIQENIKKYNGEVSIANLPIIQSNTSLLFTTLKNLIENGLKFNQSEKPTVKISYKKHLAHHEIIVADNGIGIDKKYHNQIFEMFKGLHNRGAYKGSGIGLAIVKLSVKKLGGEVQLESEEGKGSQFSIMLPIQNTEISTMQ